MTYKNIWTANLVVFCVVVCLGLAIWLIFTLTTNASIDFDSNTLYPIASVVDGDTFKVYLSEKVITVRVLGINTPETVDPRRPAECYGQEASFKAKELLDGRSVKLVLNPNRESKDKYGRYLAYVYRDDGLFYNEFMIKEGYAKEYTVGTPYSFQKEFRADQKEAQSSKKGLWGTCVASSTKKY